MLKKDFLSFFSRIWSRPGGPHILGHSFRIGGTVALLLAGIPPEVVTATGGWTLLSFLLYWRRLEEIIPLWTSLAYSRSQLDHVSSTMYSYSSSLSSTSPAS
jgi:hypothetical protein